MKSNLLQFAATAALFATLSQLWTGVTAVAVREHAIQERAIAHLKPLDDAEDVSHRLSFGPKDKRAIKHVKPLKDAEEVSHHLTFDKRTEEIEERAIKHEHALDDAEEVSNRIHFASLEKRKGGGGGGKGGGGSSRGGGGGRSSGGGSGVSSSNKGSSYGYRTYGGRYGGGSTLAYRAGGRSPLGLVPFLLPLAAVALIFPGLWLYNVYSYRYNTLYSYYNETLGSTISVPVYCLCMQYSACSCDDDGDISYLSELIALNQPNTTVFSNVEDDWSLLINGTVANGTGPITADYEEDDVCSDEQCEIINTASALNVLGYFWVVGVACYMAYAM